MYGQGTEQVACPPYRWPQRLKRRCVVITNTGNMDAYIRAHITANWFGYAGSKYGVAVGYKGQNSSEFVDAWRMDGTTGDNLGGVFEGLPGSGWTRGADGFF